MDKEKTMIVSEANPKTDVIFQEWINRGYNAKILFKKQNKLMRAIRRIWLRSNLPFSRIWLDNWLNELQYYNTLIIQMSWLTNRLPLLINKKFPELRIICWYWNTIDKKNYPLITNNPKIELWSFDDDDCIKYNMHKNIQYYSKPESSIKVNKVNDIYFVGLAKGRENIIKEFKTIAESKGITCNFNIVNKNNYIPYREVIERTKESKAVLEINKDNQVGYTLRTLESLFYEIKLITNNKNIKKSKLYNKNNIFIIGENSYDELKNFINSDYDNSVCYLKKEFDLDTWFDNFDKIKNEENNE